MIDGGLEAVRGVLAAVCPAEGSAAMLDQIRTLRELASVLAAAEATVTATFVAARRAEQVAAGLPARRVGQGIPREIGLARRESSHRAGRYAGFASILTRELPETFAALRAGVTSEWRAVLVARETGWLGAEDRAAVDAELGPRVGELSDRAVEAQAARLAYAADPQGKLRQIKRAAGGRHVSLRPAPDAMARFSAMLPLEQAVAAYAALDRVANSARAAGDQRSRGAVMADTLVERVTGQSRADAVPLRINLIMTDQTLASTGPGADEPATVSGVGPVPAAHAHDLINRACDGQAEVSVRRLVTDPAGRLLTMETESRCFTPAMAEFIRLRDQWCSTPYCGAPIRHIDHIVAAADGGDTSLDNAQGLCEACNYARQAPGWSTTRQSDGSITVTTPTGHDSATLARGRPSEAEERAVALLAAAPSDICWSPSGLATYSGWHGAPPRPRGRDRMALARSARARRGVPRRARRALRASG